jgi:hypothetical protein
MKAITGYKEAVELARKILESEAGDRKSGIFGKTIRFRHCDGSECEFRYASSRKLDKKGKWIAIFTEHHGLFVHHYDDLEWVVEVRNKVLHHYIFGD